MTPKVAEKALFQYVLALGDDALVLGHRLSEWSGHAPMLEEDIALSNLALDLIGQARLYYAYATELEGRGKSEDDLAYFRDARKFRNVLLVEQPNGDFAATMMRHLLYASFVHLYLQALARSEDRRLAEIAAKAVREMAYHVRHASEWVVRLGDGTEESHERLSRALVELWPYAGELFRMDDGEAALAASGVAVARGGIAPAWKAKRVPVFAAARLDWPADAVGQTGGRKGRHTEAFGKMLAEMQSLARAHPGVTW
jgi:ring-1,2-phenylacetyl-CoA epoxidase subunit PaaC